MARTDRNKVSMWLYGDTHRILKKMAIKEEVCLSELIRRMIDKQLSIDAINADIDEVRSHIRAEIENYFNPQVNRIMKMIVKSGIVSAAGLFTNMKALECFVAPHLQEELADSFNEARKTGIAYMSARDSRFNDFFDGKEYENE